MIELRFHRHTSVTVARNSEVLDPASIGETEVGASGESWELFGGPVPCDGHEAC